jgi:iron complex transport system permease protein
MIVVVGSATAGFSFAGTSAWIGLPLVSLGAFAGGILAVVLVYRLARSNDGTSVATMLLAGIGITALSGSFTSLLEFYATNDMLRRISLWRMGGLDGVTEQALILALSTAMVLTIYLSRFGHQLNALLLGESEARHLGIPVESLKRQLVIVVAAGVGVSVALTGAIGFIGLVIPHIVRLAIGPDHRYLLPASALAGAVLLVLSDMIARTLLAPTEIPVGIVTALVGVPFFISLLHRRRLYAMETS